ncbi:PRTRC system protein F [Burkholderia vietnamiensis]|uniref:PRTRC system protein F n=1 Tax=Burkholderia vietnamiensis TaxID=60552 RepID=UPI001D14C051|nr:PRTRC system protein F [Burkholderia vietnamiensis]UEC01655.1 PRTRC system protein F [Burkholderia vietnamiensis]
MNTALQPSLRMSHGLPTAISLALPRLSCAVPRTVVPGALAAANATIARLLLDADVFDEADIPESWDNSLRACEEALAARIRREIGPLHCLSPSFGMYVLDAEGHAIGGYAYGKPAAKHPAYGAIEVYWGEAKEQEWPVGSGLQALEAALPGLGQTILQVLRQRCVNVYPLFTPDIACDVASLLYWCGAEDEEEALDMNCGDDEEEREAMRSEMLTRAALEQAYPAWARQWMGRSAGKSTGRCSLRHAAKVITDPRLRQIVIDAQALLKLHCDDNFRSEVEGEYIGFGAVLSWEEGDVTTRIYDDLLQMAHESEYCERMGELSVPLDDPGAFGAWLQAMQPRFQAIRLIDRLIHELAA